MSIPPFLPVMVRPAQATSLVAATAVPVCRSTGALPVVTLRTFFPAATGLLYNMGHGMQAVPVVTSPDGEMIFLMPDFSLQYVATFAGDQRFALGNAGDCLPALALENHNSSGDPRAAPVAGEPQQEDVTRRHGNLNGRLVKLEEEVAESGKKVLELLREKDKFEVLKRKVGEMGQVLEKVDGFEEVGRVVKDARELRREVAEVKEMVTDLERAVESASDVSASTKVHMSEIALLKEDAEKRNADHDTVRAEVIVLKEEMEERIKAAAKSSSQVDHLEGEVDYMKGDVNQLKGDVIQLKGDILILNALVKKLSELNKGDSNDDVLNNNGCTEVEKKAALQHTWAENGDKKEEKGVVPKNEKAIGLEAGISDEANKTATKKGKKGECVDIEEEVEEEKPVPTFISMKPKLTRKLTQRK